MVNLDSWDAVYFHCATSTGVRLAENERPVLKCRTGDTRGIVFELLLVTRWNCPCGQPLFTLISQLNALYKGQSENVANANVWEGE
jgi:hypothetical protein